MLIACYLLDWKPFGIFISYLIEVVVLVLIFSIIRLKDERENPERYRKVQALGNILIGVIPLIVFQYFVIGWMASFINPEENFIQENLLFTKEFLFAVLFIVILYTINAFQIVNRKERIKVFQDNFLFKVLGITGANILGFVLAVGIEWTSFLPVLTVTVVFRIFLEIYFARKMKFV